MYCQYWSERERDYLSVRGLIRYANDVKLLSRPRASLPLCIYSSSGKSSHRGRQSSRLRSFFRTPFHHSSRTCYLCLYRVSRKRFRSFQDAGEKLTARRTRLSSWGCGFISQSAATASSADCFVPFSCRQLPHPPTPEKSLLLRKRRTLSCPTSAARSLAHSDVCACDNCARNFAKQEREQTHSENRRFSRASWDGSVEFQRRSRNLASRRDFMFTLE